MKTKPNILIVHNYYQQPGGEDTVVRNEKKLLEEHGHKVVLYTRSNRELDGWGSEKKPILAMASIFNFRTFRDIRKIIQKEKIDIVHVHNTLALISPSVYYAALSMGIPVVQTVHNFRLLCPEATFYRDGHICEDCVTKGLGCAIKHKCYRQSRMQTLACVLNMKLHRATGIYRKINYICLTDFNKDKLLQLKQIDKKRVFVKPNFVEDTGKVIPYEKRKDQYVFAGRLEKRKGVDLLLRAWNQLPEPVPQLILYGSGPLEGWCREYIEKNRLKQVEMRGFVEHEKVLETIAESKALVFPTQCYEGFPMAIVESYSCGTPVLGSRLGNAGSLIHDGRTGYHFRHDSVQELLDCIEKIQDMSELCYQYYKTNFDTEENYNRLIKIYEASRRRNSGKRP